MLQIKTIKEPDPNVFDDTVNRALAEGWTLARRLTGPTDFVAELEKVVITEDERTCENCRHQFELPDREPCLSCSGNCSNWEALE